MGGWDEDGDGLGGLLAFALFFYFLLPCSVFLLGFLVVVLGHFLRLRVFLFARLFRGDVGWDGYIGGRGCK